MWMSVGIVAGLLVPAGTMVTLSNMVVLPW